MSIKKAIIFTVMLVMLVPGLARGEMVAVLDEIMKPTDSMVVHDGKLYLTEGSVVFLYSLSDYKLIKKFGRKGEGPEEFKSTPIILPRKDHLLLNSTGKLSYFTKDGEFIKERKVGAGLTFQLLPVKEGFIGLSFLVEKNMVYRAISCYDNDLNKGKELYRVEFGERGGKRELLGDTFVYQVINDCIFVVNSSEFTFDVLDHSGNKIKTITRDHKRRPYTKDDDKEIHEILKLQLGPRYEAAKNIYIFPKDHWPSILSLLSADEKLFVPTWNIKDNKIEFFIYDAEGNELSHKYIPFAFRNAFQPFPLAIDKGKLYQVIENEDEEWELHISKIE
ncbi:MAG: hypothetical protein GY940_16725 [bacterium]|nr:hypothetical protein [bacterium]